MKPAVCILVTLLVGAVNAAFDCRRESTDPCQNGASCQQSDGTCTGCTAATHEGYDCSVVVADKGHADCTPTNPCLNGGTCHRAAAGAATFTCLCTEDFTGTTCTDKRYVVDCSTANQMTLTIRPQVSTFSGNIYVEGKVGVANCEMTQASAGVYSKSALLNTNPECGNAAVDGTTGAISRKFVVRFTDGTINVEDEVVTFICGGDTVAKTVAAVVVTAVQTNVKTKTESTSPTDPDVTFTLTKKSDGSAGTGNQELGTQLEVTAGLSTVGQTKFTAVRLQDCKAASHADAAAATTAGETFKEMSFIASNCIHADLKSSFVGIITRDGMNVKFTFRVFKIDTSSEVYVKCTIKACATATDCDAIACGSETAGQETGLGRKKREAGSVDKFLSKSYTVSDPLGTALAKSIEDFKKEKACYQTWEMNATVVALAVALLLVLLLCLILIVKAILNRRTRTAYRDDASVTTSTDHLPHLPTIVSNKA